MSITENHPDFMTEEEARMAARIGRTDVNDLDAILSVDNPDRDAAISTVEQHGDVIFTWDYDKGVRPGLNKLYEKAKHAQWDGEKDLPWELEVDQEAMVHATGLLTDRSPEALGFDIHGTPFEKWGDKEWVNLGIQNQNWMLSQFLHGEQGALICTAKIVETVPWIDAKYYASTQVMDEARHVEVFAKYLDTKLSGHYPINPHLKLLLDDIIRDSRWDMTYLGMQIMVEGLALAAFGLLHSVTPEPLLKKLLRYVMSDEARHVAFGVLSLKEVYAGMSDVEIFERQEFAFDAAIHMRDRFLQQEIWEEMGMPVRESVELFLQSPGKQFFQLLLFSKIVPNCKKLGLLDRNDKWLRRRFEEIGVIQFEDWADTEFELDEFALTDADERSVAAAR